MKNKLYGTTFYGNEASDYAIEHGYLDYATLAKAFDAILNNGIIQATQDIGYWEIDNGSEIYYEDINGYTYAEDEKEELVEELETEIAEFEEQETEESEARIKEIEDNIERLSEPLYNEIFQYFIISDEGARILRDFTNEIVFYNETLDMYVWGVTHWGTSWNYVLTDIKLNCGDEAYR